MSSREKLAKLCTHLAKPLNEYIAIDVVQELAKNTTLLAKLEPFHLPEITKLICGFPGLIDRFNADYQLLRPFYEDSSADAMIVRMADTDKDSPYYIEKIFPLSDSSIIDGFIQAFNRIERQIKYYQSSIKEQQEEEIRTLAKIDGNAAETATVLEALAQFPEGCTDDKCKELQRRRSSLKGNLTKYNKSLEAVHEKLATLNGKYELLCEQYRRLIEAVGVARKIKETYQADLSAVRQEAYNACDERNAILNMVQQTLHTGEVQEDFATGLKQYDFCVQFVSLLNKTFIDEAVPIISMLFEQGVIDICDEPFSAFLATHPDKLSQYFISTYLLADRSGFDLEAIDFDSWCDFIITQAFFDTDNQAAYELFDPLWDEIPSPGCWKTILDFVRDRDEDNLVNCLAKLILRVSGNSRKHLIAAAQDMIRSEELDGSSSLVVALIDNHVPGDDCAAIVELLLQKIEGEHRKLKGTNERLKFNADRMSAKAYGALSKPIESLEILASNIATAQADISPEMISSKMKKYLVSLREGMEVLDIYALEDAANWVENKAIPFNPDNHSISLSTPPQTVYLRTLGFSYRDTSGSMKAVPAVVGRLQELGKTKAGAAPDNKPKRSNRGKPNSNRGANTKNKNKKKDGAKE